jgi:CII-binding regulator of phage lambda lysogenization HflD
MTRNYPILVVMFVALLAPSALAQHGGHGGSSSGGYGHAGHSSEMRDFQRALMLQATREQRAIFAQCTEATQRVRTLADQLFESSSRSGGDVAVFGDHTKQLQAALEAMASAHGDFRQSLSSGQEKELKKYLRRLERLQADVTSRFAQLEREFPSNGHDPRRLNRDIKKFRELTDKWAGEHQTIAKEMGINR